MYNIWNPYYSSYFMQVPQMFPLIPPQMFVNPVPFVTPNQNIFSDNLYSADITKNIEKNTEQSSKNIIQISSDSQSEIEQIEPPKNLTKNEPSNKKSKNDRFLGFKEGIFEKENNSPTKSTMNLRKRTLLTRRKLRKHKGIIIHQKLKQKSKNIQKLSMLSQVRLSSRLSKNNDAEKIKNNEKKPRNKQFGRLKKYLKCVGKTVELPSMYTLQSNYKKLIQQKRQNLLLRKIE